MNYTDKYTYKHVCPRKLSCINKQKYVYKQTPS